jgi:hypothetical protein
VRSPIGALRRPNAASRELSKITDSTVSDQAASGRQIRKLLGLLSEELLRVSDQIMSIDRMVGRHRVGRPCHLPAELFDRPYHGYHRSPNSAFSARCFRRSQVLYSRNDGDWIWIRNSVLSVLSKPFPLRSPSRRRLEFFRVLDQISLKRLPLARGER